jgi:hypothetical protein
VSRGAALTGALLATLETPATWPLALATFLVRGGLVVVLVPIVVLPTPVGFGNIFAPALASIALGSVSVELVVASVGAALAIVGWIVLGGWLAAAFEVEAAWMIAGDADARSPTASDERSGPPGPMELARPAGTAWLAARILLARLVAFIPLAVVLAVGTVRIVLVTYRELTSPLDTSTPVVLRILRDTPEVIVAVIVAWTIGEMVSAIAARRITFAGDGVAPALRSSVVTCVRHPLVTLTRFWLPTIVLLAILIPYAAGAGSAWSAVDAVLDGSSDLPMIGPTVVLFVVLWLVGLVLIAVVSAWRAAVWTVAEMAREGTFGGSRDRQTGDWRTDRSSATL